MSSLGLLSLYVSLCFHRMSIGIDRILIRGGNSTLRPVIPPFKVDFPIETTGDRAGQLIAEMDRHKSRKAGLLGDGDLADLFDEARLQH